MSELKKEQPQSIKSQSPRPITNGVSGWTSAQAYLLAAFCLLLGVALGYLFRDRLPRPRQLSPLEPVNSKVHRPRATMPRHKPQ